MKKFLLAIILMGVALICAHAQPISVRLVIPRLDLFMGARFSDNGEETFALDTRSRLDLNVDTSGKVGVGLRIGFDGTIDTSTSQLRSNAGTTIPLSLDLLRVSLGDVNTDPVYLTLFTGRYDFIGLGRDFGSRFNSDFVYLSYSGERYAKNLGNGLTEEYEGLFEVVGSGLKFGTNWGTNDIATELYLYQDNRFNVDGATQENAAIAGAGTRAGYSIDVRGLYNSQVVQVDTYAGVSFLTPVSDDDGVGDDASLAVTGRGGVMLNLNVAPEFQLYSQLGIPWIDFTNLSSFVDNFGLEQFQVLIEPRFTIAEVVGIHFTALVRPVRYNQQVRRAAGLDLNLKMLFGVLAAESVQGGFDVRVEFEEGLLYDSLNISPFVRLIFSGILFEIAGDMSVFPFEPLESLRIFLTARTSIN